MQVSLTTLYFATAFPHWQPRETLIKSHTSPSDNSPHNRLSKLHSLRSSRLINARSVEKEPNNRSHGELINLNELNSNGTFAYEISELDYVPKLQ